MVNKNLKDELIKFDKLAKNKRPILYVHDLYKKYAYKKKPAINKISFEVYKGHIHAFVGANGAGKTTTIKCIIGAYAKWKGTILINGIKNTNANSKRYLGYIPEYAQFPKKISCFKYLLWMAILSGMKKKPAKEKVNQMLSKYKLTNLAHKHINSLSSGQKKQILIIQATIHEPDIIIMDEPTANLDPKARKSFFDLLLKFKKENKAIFISSHNLSELNQYADSITILDGGKIVFSGKIHDLVAKYQKNEYEVKTNNNKTFVSLLKKWKIPYMFTDNNKTITIYFETPYQKQTFLKNIKKSNVIMTNFAEKPMSLDDVYDNMIKLGSMDTMSEN